VQELAFVELHERVTVEPATTLAADEENVTVAAGVVVQLFFMQLSEQASGHAPLAVPVSHCSPGSKMPLPHTGVGVPAVVLTR
jgi:hypothetical protein